MLLQFKDRKKIFKKTYKYIQEMFSKREHFLFFADRNDMEGILLGINT